MHKNTHKIDMPREELLIIRQEYQFQLVSELFRIIASFYDIVQ